MTRSRVVPFCLLVLLIPPLTSSAQSKNPFATGTAAQLPPSSAVTSVRELQIPEKARKACESGAQHSPRRTRPEAFLNFKRPSELSQATTKRT